MEVERRRYYRLVLRQSWRRLWGTTAERIAWRLQVTACAFVVGLLLGLARESLVAGLIGGVGGLFLAGLLSFLWRLVSAPAEIHANQEEGLRATHEQTEALRLRVLAFEGSQILLSDDLEIASLNMLPADWCECANQTSALLRCKREIPGSFTVKVLVDATVESGGGYLVRPDVIENGAFKLEEYQRFSLSFEGPLELPNPRVEVVSEMPPTYIQRDALLTLWVGSPKAVRFLEIQILPDSKPPADPPSSRA